MLLIVLFLDFNSGNQYFVFKWFMFLNDLCCVSILTIWKVNLAHLQSFLFLGVTRHLICGNVDNCFSYIGNIISNDVFLYIVIHQFLEYNDLPFKKRKLAYFASTSHLPFHFLIFCFVCILARCISFIYILSFNIFVSFFPFDYKLIPKIKQQPNLQYQIT